MRVGDPPSGVAADGDTRPLIVTLRMDPASASYFTGLRRTHFPAHRNWLDAHITLFHALPGAALEKVICDVEEVASRLEAITLRTASVLFLGAGVAFELASEDAARTRRELASRWDTMLSRQDRAWRGPLHITVQNKVAPAAARGLHRQLRDDFSTLTIVATGIDIWHYNGGPWKHAKLTKFRRNGESDRETRQRSLAIGAT